MKTVLTSEKDIEKAAEIIRNGGLVAFPTETVYGLGANALDGEAAKKIYAAKGRPSDNPLIVHLAQASDAEKYAYTSPLYYKLADSFMPGPITVILPKKDIVPKSVTGGLDTVAVRVPVNETARNLIKCAGVPICAPSANTSGKPSPTCADHVMHDLDGKIDMVIDGGVCDIGLESTIVKINSDNSLTLCRPGAITLEMLHKVCADVKTDRAIEEKADADIPPIAPGMKYRHYAPEIPVIIIDGNHECARKYILEHAEKQKCGALIYNEDIPYFQNIPYHVIGSIDDMSGAAHELFDALRAFDERKDISLIYAFMPDKSGIGLAVFNRLIKAAGFKIIRTDEE